MKTMKAIILAAALSGIAFSQTAGAMASSAKLVASGLTVDINRQLPKTIRPGQSRSDMTAL